MIVDKRNKVSPGMQPLLAGMTMVMLAIMFDVKRVALNPARDLGPRLFMLCVGYGWETFR